MLCGCVEDGLLPQSKVNSAVYLSYVSTAIGSVVQNNHIAARQLIQLCTQVGIPCTVNCTSLFCCDLFDCHSSTRDPRKTLWDGFKKSVKIWGVL